jgi:nucleotide-binding universal stress UspA family protein
MTSPRIILVPTDFSDTANAALDYAKFFAREFDAKLHVVHVLQSPFAYVSAIEGSPELAFLREEMSKDAGRRLHTAVTADERRDFDVRTTAMWGIPWSDIVDYAKKNDVDLIVMGTHGRSGIQRMFLGSVAEKVVRHAACPVLTVRISENATTQDVTSAA